MASIHNNSSWGYSQGNSNVNYNNHSSYGSVFMSSGTTGGLNSGYGYVEEKYEYETKDDDIMPTSSPAMVSSMPHQPTSGFLFCDRFAFYDESPDSTGDGEWKHDYDSGAEAADEYNLGNMGFNDEGEEQPTSQPTSQPGSACGDDDSHDDSPGLFQSQLYQDKGANKYFVVVTLPTDTLTRENIRTKLAPQVYGELKEGNPKGYASFQDVVMMEQKTMETPENKCIDADELWDDSGNFSPFSWRDTRLTSLYKRILQKWKEQQTVAYRVKHSGSETTSIPVFFIQELACYDDDHWFVKGRNVEENKRLSNSITVGAFNIYKRLHSLGPR